MFEDLFQLQIIPSYAFHNGHLFYLLFRSKFIANEFKKHMNSHGVQVASHYVGLHSSHYGKSNSRYIGDMRNTNKASNCLIRLPIWEGLNVECVIDAISKSLKKL